MFDGSEEREATVAEQLDPTVRETVRQVTGFSAGWR
jgi:hypothetical protein